MKDSIFKAYDIRGIYPDEINEEAAYKVGRALVRFLSAKTIVLGRDMRHSSPALARKMIEGINCEGADVVDLGICTTPMLNFAVGSYGYDGGVMISASHNPGQYNAFKLIKRGPLQLDETSGIDNLRLMVRKGFSSCKESLGSVSQKDALNDYLSHVLRFANEIKPLKIIVDYGNGVGSISGKPALARLDLDVKSFFEEPNGDFPNHPANPHDAKNFSFLQNSVIKEKADLGVFFDGDADRAIMVDDTGRMVPTDLLFVLLAEDDLARDKGEKYYFDLRFSKSVPEFIKKLGGIPVMMKVGNPVYKKALHEDGGRIAAEFSGHIMFSDNMNIDDGLFALIKTLTLLSQTDKRMSQLIEEVSIYCDSEEISLEAPNPEKVFENIIKDFPEADQIEIDGVYLDFSDGFISVRQSQTEPQLFRIRVEAQNKKTLEERLAKVKKIVGA